ncbi:DUF1553 domain-containing protein [Flavilitoribacter nigricans]|uniref:Cytochrome c domain-containing protein n=1 Tax=Flavilitoribacter nigricans (strain ATCC 23147 / DSM 23189 / NBRC 102662 / NCIMB 1420 / SS-2) TaxID=1122177 RepID=A0A2D0NJ23_FLAN2|nr:DUF1553 domain-containing protein [Flavilitoribacter nigricans]PHN07753.1 hypothetical protein CRP01_04735 [Flavilitoribacter nigricans DSM 23189 = NBRC 102662]
MSFRNILLPVLVIGLIGSLSFWQCRSTSATISYNQHIRPIFNAKCLACHGGVRKSGGFSLLFEEEAFAATESGKAAIVPGQHGKSELFRRLTHQDPELRMPLDGQHLTEEEIDLIARWIDEGAKWEEHWAYIPPQPIAIPQSGADWKKNDIDPFVFRKLQALELEPAPEADRSALLRRVSLDLTGLPPTPEAVDAFLTDDSPDAYEKLVDSLLASPHFGEHWAAMWLDLARYADSKGYEKDPYRNIWRYRDWVIGAFNRDLPFDEFTIEQLAGDMLPDPDRDQLIATAFHRNTMTNTEGGTDDEEFRVAAVIDRLNTTYEVWQATTMSCVQCHSHPYDPIRHEAFYESYDYFNQSQDGDLDNEMPRLATFPRVEAERVREIIGFIQDLGPSQTIDTSADLETQIRQALFPELLPTQADDFENVSFNNNGVVSNWIYNLKSIAGKRFRFMFEQVDLDQLEQIRFRYQSQGNDAWIELRIDEPEGRLLAKQQFTANANVNGEWGGDLLVPVEAGSGKHDLYFEIINTTNKAPDGMVRISEIELQYAEAAVADPQLQAYRKELREIQTQRVDYTPVMKPKVTAMERQTKLFDRGNWMVQTTPLEGGVPRVMLQGEEMPANRLAFARWLVSEDNPLTARVIVNRFWARIFGRGLIETLEDFGTQSDPPTHPELLDHLALRFMQEHGWSVKSLLREIVTSATYRQSSKANAQKLELDPDNRWLSRGPRFRLTAEQIRDQALAVSGLLNDSIGGRSVMPPQPEGVWQIVYSGEQWRTSSDSMRHRRGLYTYWKRTTPYPSMIAFDSPSREFCVSRRIRTNTPLQALVTLNDPAFLEAAQALAQRMREAGGQDLEAAIRAGYKRALGQEADAETVAILRDLHLRAQSEMDGPTARARTIAFTEDPNEIELTDPMAVVANAILNLDGFLTKQ